jgi:hypothetical protein
LLALPSLITEELEPDTEPDEELGSDAGVDVAPGFTDVGVLPEPPSVEEGSEALETNGFASEAIAALLRSNVNWRYESSPC